MERLLAKSWGNEGQPASEALLPGHLRAVYEAAQAVLHASADDQLRALGLTPEKYRERLHRIVLFAAAIHDLGKANDQFQAMVRGALGHGQALRHEWVTYLLLTQEPWRDWSAKAFADGPDWHIALWCATGHHPGYNRASPPTAAPSGTGTELTVFLSHPDFSSVVKWIVDAFDLDTPPEEEDRAYQLAGVVSEAHAATKQACRKDERVWESLDVEQRQLAAAAKACLIAADVAGSALPKHTATSEQASGWVRSALATRPEPRDIEGLVRERVGRMALRPFQQDVAASDSRVTVVCAGCGTGKTIAAYLWAAHRWAGRRVYFCYPTTGTATEGFRGYLFNEDEGRSKYGAQLFHSRACVDLEMILGVADDLDEHDTTLRVESLRAWSTPIVSCTVDTVLGLMQNHRRGLFAWPALTQSAFVFDEIHAYDRELFGALLKFIETMRGVPILLMTASLPAGYLRAIERCMKRTGGGLTRIDGPVELEKLPRYRRRETIDVLGQVQREYETGGKVLWVCNTVRRAMDAAAAAEKAGLSQLVYHSRFRYQDRVERHRDVVSAFERDGPALAICTQVAEMSLDLSATLLVSDLAPVPAVIQRLGRLNRRAARGDPVRSFVIVEPRDATGKPTALPYKPAELGVSRAWLNGLGDGPLSQTDLAAAWQQELGVSEPTPVTCAWIDGGPSTRVGELREGSPALRVILDGQDVADVDAAVAEAARGLAQRGTVGALIARVVLPMPPPGGINWKAWRRIKGIPVAPADAVDYDAKRGGQWRRQ